MESIVVALIGGIVTLAGVLIANSRTQAVIEAKLNELTKRVDKHNQLIERTYALEADMRSVKERLSEKE